MNSSVNQTGSADISIQGAGLSGALLATRLKLSHPNLKLAVVEKNSEAVSDQVWSFYGSDLTPGSLAWMKPYLRKSWNCYEVKFPTYNRVVNTSYHSIDAGKIRNHLKSLLGPDLLLNSTEQVRANIRVDARGNSNFNYPNCGWQKFLGIEYELSRPHGLQWPIVMDATCEQKDGFRFIYVLPWDEKNLLIEDTRYSDTPTIDETEFEKDIVLYARKMGFSINSEIRRERGALPIPLKPQPKSRLTIGTAGGFFHPITGYSAPFAIELSNRIANLSHVTADAVQSEIEKYSTDLEASQRFAFKLSALLFLGASPSERIKIFEKFYRHSQPLIERFYKLDIKTVDKVSIFSGRPPISIVKAFQILRNST